MALSAAPSVRQCRAIRRAALGGTRKRRLPHGNGSVRRAAATPLKLPPAPPVFSRRPKAARPLRRLTLLRRKGDHHRQRHPPRRLARRPARHCRWLCRCAAGQPVPASRHRRERERHSPRRRPAGRLEGRTRRARRRREPGHRRHRVGAGGRRLRARPSGGAASAYRRSFTLSRELDASRIEAGRKDGVLALRISKAEEARPRLIEVKVG